MMVMCRAAPQTRVRITRFSNVDAAEAEVKSLGSTGYRSDRFVIEFLDPSLTDEERKTIESTVEHTATVSPD